MLQNSLPSERNTPTLRKPYRLLKRSAFLKAAASGVRFVSPAFVLQISQEVITLPRYGLTATKKLGNAVKRNRARRRLRALAENHLLPKAAAKEYVLIAREAIFSRPYAQLVLDIEKALRVLKCQKQAS